MGSFRLPGASTAARRWPARSQPRFALSPDSLALRVVERLARDLTGDPLPEDVDRHLAAHLDLLRQVGVRDRALHRVAISAARHPPDHLAVYPHGLVSKRNRSRVLEHEAPQAPSQGGGSPKIG